MVTPVHEVLSAWAFSPAHVWLPTLGVLLLGYLWTRDRLHRRALRSTATAFGLHCLRGHDPEALQRFEEFCILRLGHSRRVVDRLVGTIESQPILVCRVMTELGGRASRMVCEFVLVIIERSTATRSLILACRAAPWQRCPHDHLLQDRENEDDPWELWGLPGDVASPLIPAVRAWLQDQPQEFSWQVTSCGVCGYTPYRCDSETIGHLIRSTMQLAEYVGGSRSA